MLLTLVFGMIAAGCFFYAVQAEFRVKAMEGELLTLRRKNEEAALARSAQERARLAELVRPSPPPVDPIPTPALAPVDPIPTPAPATVAEPEVSPGIGGDAGEVGSAVEKLDAASIAKVMARIRPAMKRCYDVALGDDPEASGKLQVSLTISAAGTVEKVTVTPSGKLPASVGTCVSRVVKTARFPASSSSTNVTYPVVFTSA